MKTLPDFLSLDIRILSVGLNPSLNAVTVGYLFATAQNRFWKALNQSTLIDEALVPGVAAMKRLVEWFGIGFTDVVKRPTRGLQDLSSADFKRDAPRLRTKIERYRPALVWFHGKVACQRYLRYGENRRDDTAWGAQGFEVGRALVYVTPNPSPANAAFSLADIVISYDALGAYLRQQRIWSETIARG